MFTLENDQIYITNQLTNPPQARQYTGHKLYPQVSIQQKNHSINLSLKQKQKASLYPHTANPLKTAISCHLKHQIFKPPLQRNQYVQIIRNTCSSVRVKTDERFLFKMHIMKKPTLAKSFHQMNHFGVVQKTVKAFTPWE